MLVFLAPGFFTRENLSDLVLANMPVLIVALGMTLVILTGHIDISVGTTFAICGVAAGEFAKMGLPAWGAGLVACAIGAMLGAINGALVAYLRIPSIVVTLAAMVAFRDALRWITQGAWVQDLPANFQWLGTTQAASNAITFAVAGALAIGIGWGLRNLPAGRSVYATGSNENAARLVGIDSARVTFCVFAFTGALTGCAALLNSIRFNQVPSNAGIGMEMKVITAVVVGGTAITGGRGSIQGTLLGVVLLGIISPALTFLGFSAYWERAIQGLIILSAVGFDAVRSRFGARLRGDFAERTA
ncbi:MAG TPA: ABC transporter permease [Bryobacteraceae bacterium]|nr:ABC transporter permease [Bryobacteraceae bacterium]